MFLTDCSNDHEASCFLLQQKISSSDCGVKKVCFSRPSDCEPALSTPCYFMSAMMVSSSDTTVHYELTGPSDGYISFGFSDDQIMVTEANEAKS